MITKDIIIIIKCGIKYLVTDDCTNVNSVVIKLHFHPLESIHPNNITVINNKHTHSLFLIHLNYI